jgi:hypothetical protein
VLTDYKPEIRLEGRGVLDQALHRGKGAILWFDNFRYHSLIGKRPFAEAGYECWQLSSAYHGLSPSKFGKHFLNTVQRKAEARYVAGRIDVEASTVLKATRRVAELLAANGVVRITNNVSLGRQVIFVPIGASAWIPIATTPLNLARLNGAALLPVAVIEEEPFRQYCVTVGQPLPVSGGDKRAAFRETALQYAAYLEPLVHKYPDQWMAWAGRRSRLRESAGQVV